MIKEDMDWKEVDSSQIAAISFNNKEQAVYIKFKRGQVWKYSPFTFSEYGEMMNAPSIGKHFHSEIKTNKNSQKLSDGNKPKK